jgi:hypothetical protein
MFANKINTSTTIILARNIVSQCVLKIDPHTSRKNKRFVMIVCYKVVNNLLLYYHSIIVPLKY